MNFFNARRDVAAVVVSLGTLALTGCAALSPATPEEAVQRRSTEYWQARTKGQLEQAYAFTAPSFRKVRTLNQYRSNFGNGASVESAQVVGVQCEAERCAARLKLDARPAIMGMNLGAVPMYIDEVWILEDGQWWLYQEL